jgi:predicted RND superfamily exporter protein
MDERIGRWLAAWVQLVRRNPRAVIAISFLATVLLGVYAARNLAMNMDTTTIMSQELPLRG